jgi:hypothetical protein
VGFKLTTLVMIGTDCIGSLKSNYHTITNTKLLKMIYDIVLTLLGKTLTPIYGKTVAPPASTSLIYKIIY